MKSNSNLTAHTIIANTIHINLCTYRKAIQNLSYDGEEHDTGILNCGDVANFTFYDDLIGIAQRYNHPIVPEPEVSMHFNTKGTYDVSNE